MTYKVGDRVMSTFNGNYGMTGTIRNCLVDSGNYHVTWDDKSTVGSNIFAFCYLKPIAPAEKVVKTMALNTIAKAILGKKTKALIEAGYLDSSLNLTGKGKDTIDALLFKEYKDQLIEMALKEVEEAKAAKKS